jgi:eukaryotic-like serine/threonine-protein kinase
MGNAGVRTRAKERLGTVLAGKYELERLIATGGMGAVYAAWQPFLQRRVAVKILHADLVHCDEHTERFLRESRMASALNHPNIVTVLDGGLAEDGAPYLVQELLEGEDLHSALSEDRVGTSDVFDIALSLLDALSAAHAAGIVHRDIKPENVFLAYEAGGIRKVKLLDFGIGKSDRPSDSLTDPGFALGSPGYMSPEQALEQPVDARADIWGVGALLFHALAGVTPYHDENLVDLLTKIATAPAPSLAEFRPDLPAWLIQIVDRALRRECAERFQSASQMAEALRRRGAVEEAVELWD